jgi:hypothetical protein
VAVKEEFDGQGRVVLTASRAMEYAFEGDTREGDAQPSIFTSAIVEALETGRADRDQDSRISVDELYEYVYDRVREATPSQTPSKWTFDVQGDLYIARSSYRAEVEPAALPVELRAAIESPFATVRAGAVEELARLLDGSQPAHAAAARGALEALAGDDSKRVSHAAATALGTAGPPVVALVSETVEPPRPSSPQAPRRTSSVSRVALSAARLARWKNPLALAGVGLLVLAYFRAASWDSAWTFARKFEESVWAVWSPAEAFGLALLVGSAVLASRSGRLGREGAEGIFLGAGVVAAAGALAFVIAYEAGAGFVLTVLAALALLGAGLLGLATRRAREAALPRRVAGIAAAGVILGLSPLVVNLGDWESSLLEFKWRPMYVEVLAVGLVAAAACFALVFAPRVRLHAAGLLVALGIGLALHVVGVLVQLGHDDGVGKVRYGGPLGIAGGLLLVAAGASVLRAGRAEQAPTASAVPAV